MKNTPFHLLQRQWDILGGLEAETCIRGNYDSAVYTVQSNQVIIPSSKGGGKVHHVRGIWLTSVEFSWEGYWAGVSTPGAVNYFTGGSAQNSGDQTIIALGTGLANGTQVQVYYFYGSGTFFKPDTPVEAYPAFFNAWQGKDRYKFSSAPDGDQWIALAMLEARARWEDFKYCYGWSLMESLEKFLEDPDYSIIDDFERDAARSRDNTKEFYSGADSGSSITPEIMDGAAQGRQSRILKVAGNVAAGGYAYWGEGRNVAIPIGEDGFKFLFKGQGGKKTHILRIADDFNWQTYFLKPGKRVTKKSASAGYMHCMAIKEDGSLWAWGDGNAGQLGQGNYLDYHTPIQVKGIGGAGYLSNIVKAAGNWTASFAVDSDGNAYACGGNYYGEFGQGSYSGYTWLPMKVKNSAGTGYLQEIIDIAYSFYYWASYFLDSSGHVWACGNGTKGQLGQGGGDLTNHNLPVKVKDSAGGGYLQNIKKIWAGPGGCFALDKNGDLWAWGWNEGGWMGTNDSTNRSLPVKITANVVDLAAGYDNSYTYSVEGHVILCKSDKSCLSCGRNNDGQLGDGTTNPTTVFKKILDDIVQVAACRDNGFALGYSGKVYAWGRNYRGEHGQNNTVQHLTPVIVKDEYGQELENIVSIWAGGHAEGGTIYMLANDGTLFACGANAQGQIGDGSTTERHLPVKVQNHVWWVDIVPGVYKFPVHDTATGWRQIEPKFSEFVRDTNLLWDGDRKADKIWGTYVPAFPQYNKITLGYNDHPNHIESGYRHFKALRVDMELLPLYEYEGGPKYPAEVGMATTPDVNSYDTPNLNFLLRLYTPKPGFPAVRVKIKGADGREHFKYFGGMDFTFWQRVTIPWEEFDNQGENGNNPILHPILALDFIFRVEGLWNQFFTCSAHIDDIKFGDHKSFQDWLDLE